MKTVGARQFRESMAKYLMSDTPFAITRHGQTVGYYVPLRAEAAEVAAVELSRTIQQLRETMAEYGITQEGAGSEVDEQGPSHRGAVPAYSSFWEHKSIDDLAAEQGVGPLQSWAQLQGYWPEDADFEEFMAAVESAREG